MLGQVELDGPDKSDMFEIANIYDFQLKDSLIVLWRV